MTEFQSQFVARRGLLPHKHAQVVALDPEACKGRVFLMLQGHPSGFWRDLAAGLEADGHRVVKANFCLADRIFWGRRPAVEFQGGLKRWRRFVFRLIEREGVTDILYYADRLPYHAIALEEGRRLRRRCWAIEFGYLRPDWLTLEPEGMGALSTFPKTRSEIEALAEGVEAPDMRNLYPFGFGVEAFNEVSFALLQSFGRPFYPLHVSDRPHWPVIEYLSWLPGLVRGRHRERAAVALTERLAAEGTPFNLVAMQLEVDYQIRASSDYPDLISFLDETLQSFAATAPADRHLVVKLHPLDSELGRWFSRIPRLARRHGIAERVHVIRGGDLGALIGGSRGVVLVNSTVGIHALRMGVPVCAMGRAVYDLPGLTHRRGLDRFWTAPDPVDTDYFQSFQRALSTIQVKGSFYNLEGRAAAIAEMRRRLAV
ncbi:hypothetical protein BV509_01380 [Rhodovulum sulfidophilum]|uniref:Capsular biosynthesis protein n=1 Tax=Rhodovulum visakhapatnamense TaxID=364297 RepID=A0ABS1RH52_9RHOB|nr:capsular biosynthesis protein [Rhodovulum visakhapatnamense]MBL3571705.1 capsular biosynthesis protein [Rhodovulum visakhapatnamense]MBL3578610.1 capsular biosynthesis protein [Rhodovulum visakhapatnamense]OLS43125.1 hypothetical protein BV509_01380 [Rhodovulum sulfidophilum]